MGGLYGIRIHQIQLKNALDMSVQVLFMGYFAQFIHRSVFETFRFGHLQDLIAFGGIKKLTPAVQQFKGIPLLWIVAGGNDDTP
ncbi:hypothetical protein SDC9_151845 [bioreactor metagenome]|uniref:Uncharacterized protein n=1 Tax=bioreactor metagenome TaxID=1076179 RepID=A0A645ETQ6_9ZZZZ